MISALFFAATLGWSPLDDVPWTPQESGVGARLRGLSVVSRDVVWASGTAGTVLRTVNGGRTWRTCSVAEGSDLDFRDIHAIDGRSAYVLAAGEGGKSRIYKTTDEGRSWTLQFHNPDPKGFFDAIAFWDAEHGIALGDPVDGRFPILTTDDGGRHWNRAAPDGMPKALENEGAYAASGTCLVTQGEGNAWFATGGAARSRVFRTTDRGRTWNVAETPVRSGAPTRGIFSLAFRNATHGIAVGGDYKAVDDSDAVVALTYDGGQTWHAIDGHAPGGYRSAATWTSAGRAGVAVGPNGSDISTDGGHTWTRLGRTGFHAVGCAWPDGPVWAVGDDGRIASLSSDIRPGH